MDSNHRRRTPADLQSAPFGHSGIFPYFPASVDSLTISCNPIPSPPGLFLEPMEGFEPPTSWLQISCSGQLSYIGISTGLGWKCMNNILIHQIFGDKILSFASCVQRTFNFATLHKRRRPKSGAKIVINNNPQNRRAIFFHSNCNFLYTYIYKV